MLVVTVLLNLITYKYIPVYFVPKNLRQKPYQITSLLSLFSSTIKHRPTQFLIENKMTDHVLTALLVKSVVHG